MGLNMGLNEGTYGKNRVFAPSTIRKSFLLRIVTDSFTQTLGRSTVWFRLPRAVSGPCFRGVDESNTSHSNGLDSSSAASG